MTPLEIQKLAEPMEAVYADIVDELMVNIGKHLVGNTTTWTAYWEVQKLQELGQLTAENAAIINKHIKDMPEALKETMEDTRKVALSKLEQQLEKAVQEGYIAPAVNDSAVDVLNNCLKQAQDKLNLTNTTMLQSSVDAYQDAIFQITERAEALQRQLELTVGYEAGQVAIGAVTRQQAVKETIQRVSDAGLTGFYDKLGRSWTPEAYVNMLLRTTVHNVAIEATKARMQDYNTEVFQVSSHAGARPGCYPYQGKFYSWNNTFGVIELGNGKTVEYEPIRNTSYGEPAGLFGINCGHFPIPIIPNVTIPHGADEIESKAVNDKNYIDSQQQRQLERQLREAKRVVEMSGKLADEEQKEKVRELSNKIAQFTAETGRARRRDRE